MFTRKCIPRSALRLRKFPFCRQRYAAPTEGISIAPFSSYQSHRILCASQKSSSQSLSQYSLNNSTYCIKPDLRIRNLRTSSSLYDDIQIVSTPPFAESVTEGNIKWLKAAGDSVMEDEVVGEIETDKTALPVTAPANGVVEELLVEDDGRVEKGDQLFKLRVGGTGAAPSPKAESPSPPAQEAAASAPKPTASPPPPPSAQKTVEPGHPPKEMPPIPPVPTAPINITKPTGVPPPPASQMVSQTDAKDAPTVLTGTRTETRVKMSRMRQRIAQRLKDSQNVNAMLTTFNEVDMSNIMELRQQHKDAFIKKHGLKLGFMSAFVKAAASGLQAMPTVNAVIDQDAVVYRDYVDISVAVATPKGLVVPVLRDVQHMDFAGIEHGINALGVKARDGNLAIEDMEGGTFTISNGGVFGSLMGTPIINPPQSSILGMHAIFDRPVAVNGKVEIRPMMYIALTYDHRLIDGREAVTFLKRIKTAVEDPRVLLLNL